ncbi:hypothetical protein IMCC21906_03110 [Spongiibacter sp. IMCC21906]|uniref:hypothetical protein n=1 Tax=Spongiibacter sp. IMCC21906 TaxID=1620392 RepID=UPI00062DEB82|nr:hypothetical protein [Spongiibacter sp. IMCC21906]AKH70750.1 hypothetical protein IMCC21906_03110 [Spongiibacter sp. IMCC21906]
MTFKTSRRAVKAALAVFFISLITACASTPQATPAQLQAFAPTPIPDNSGEYLSPYTSDAVVAEWVDKAINAKAGSAVGGAVGAYAGQKALEQVPFVGSFLGKKLGQSAGRAIAIKSSGGMDYIKSTSDLSFDSAKDLSVYLYANYSTNEHYPEVLDATMAIYPELKESYYQHIMQASREAAAIQ